MIVIVSRGATARPAHVVFYPVCASAARFKFKGAGGGDRGVGDDDSGGESGEL